MPLISFDDPEFSFVGSRVEQPRTPVTADETAAAEAEVPSLSATFGAAFRSENEIGSLLARQDLGDPLQRQDGYSAWEDIRGTKYEAKADRFMDMFNARSVEGLKRQIDQEEADDRTREASGAMGVVADISAGLLSPTMFLPGGAIVRSARTGQAVARSALSVGAAAAAGVAAQEAALQTTQETRTATETGFAIGSAALLGGLIGGGASALLSRPERIAAQRGVGALTGAPSGAVPFAATDLAEMLRFRPASELGEGVSLNANRVFHGTFSDFEHFSKEFLGKETEAASAREGFFFSDNLDVAKSYAIEDGYANSPITRWLPKTIQNGYAYINEKIINLFGASGYTKGRVLSADIDPINPKIIDGEGMADDFGNGAFTQAIQAAKAAGHDAVMFKNLKDEGFTSVGKSGDASNVWVVFDENAIKITDSRAYDDAHELLWDMVPGDKSVAAANAGSSAGGSGFGASGGAAVVTELRSGDLDVSGRVASAIVDSTAALNPNLRLNTSPSMKARQYGQEVAENTLYQGMNEEGRSLGPAVERNARMLVDSRLAKAKTQIDDVFREGRKAGMDMSRSEFEEAVGRAGAYGDQGDNEWVTSAAQVVRREVLDPFARDAKDVGLLSEDAKSRTSPTYQHRFWNRQALMRDETGFKETVKSWVREEAPKIVKSFDKRADRKLGAYQSEIDDLEMTKLRRGEELLQREAGGEAAADFDEGDIRQAIEIVRGGGGKRPDVETLTQWISKQGGLWDDRGELAARGITNKARPGFVRTNRKTSTNPTGGWDLDDIAYRAWEAGFMPGHAERPNADDLLDLLQDDFFKRRMVVREADRDSVRLSEYVAELEADLSRLGVSPASPRFATSEEVKGMVSRISKAMDAKADARIAELKKTLEETRIELGRAKADRFDVDGDFDEYATRVADEVYDKLTGRGGTGENFDGLVSNARGPLKERSFTIPDAMVERYLNRNVFDVMRRYARLQAADVELTRRYGKADMKAQLLDVQDEYRSLREQVAAAVSKDEIRQITGKGFWTEKGRDAVKVGRSLDEFRAAAIEKLTAREQADIRDIEALRDLVRGEYGDQGSNWARIVRSASSLQYIWKMGGVVVASLGDIYRPAMVHGLSRYMSEGIAPLMKQAGRAAVGMSVQEAKQAGLVVERVLQARLSQMSEIGDPMLGGTAIERLIENGTRVGSRWNGILLWTDMAQSISSVLSQNRIADALTKGGDDRLLAYLGIDRSMRGRLADYISAHGERIEGVWVANTERWRRSDGNLDEQAIRLFRAAMSKDVDSIVVKKSVGDVPLLANTPTGKMLLQFKSFALASHQRVMLRGLQERPAQFVSGVVAMSAIGAMAAYLRAWRGGEDRFKKFEQAARNPGYLIGEGLDLSGIFAIPMEAANTTEKIIGTNPIKDPLKMAFPNADQTGSSLRYQSRGVASSLLGPSAGVIDLASEVAKLSAARASGEATDKQKERLWKAGTQFVPFYSYPGMREGMNLLMGDFPGADGR